MTRLRPITRSNTLVYLDYDEIAAKAAIQTRNSRFRLKSLDQRLADLKLNRIFLSTSQKDLSTSHSKCRQKFNKSNKESQSQ